MIFKIVAILATIIFCVAAVKLGPPTGTPIDYDATPTYDINQPNSNTPINYRRREKNNIENNIFSNYLSEQIAKYGNLDGYHEENYIYNNDQHQISYYQGVLTYLIKDFDKDGEDEMALFRMTTDTVDELSGKNLIIEMIKIYNNEAQVVDTYTMSSQFLGEEITCDIAWKNVNEDIRIFVNYFDHDCRNHNYYNKFVSLEFIENFVVMADLEMSCTDEEYDDVGEKEEEIINAGIDVRTGNETAKRPFLADDVNANPLFTIKRVNEKVRDGFIEDYMATHADEINEGILSDELIRIRYGYTNFIKRSSRLIYNK